jgi:hypothetical protein
LDFRFWILDCERTDGLYLRSKRTPCFRNSENVKMKMDQRHSFLARDRRAGAQGTQLGPGDLRMDAAAYATVGAQKAGVISKTKMLLLVFLIGLLRRRSDKYRG